MPYEGGPVIARSPYFRVKPGGDDEGIDAPAALRVLVDDLTAAGWAQAGSTGRAPWDLRFVRGGGAARAAARGRR